MKNKGEEVGKGEWEAEDLHRPNKTKRGEHDYSDESSQATNDSAESLYVGCRHRIQILKEFPANYPQPHFTEGWAVTEEVLDSLFSTISNL